MTDPRRSWLLAGLVAAVASLCAWLRLDATTRGTVWAEDGMFLTERLSDGPLTTLLDPYAGYLHVLPRLIVDVAAGALPLRDFAVGVTLLCCVCVGLVSALVYACSHEVVSSQSARVALGLLTVLVPPGPIEVLGNVANLHWYLLWLFPWLLLARPASRCCQWGLAVVALLGTLSEVQSLMFVPLAVYALTWRGRRPAALGFLLGAAAQLGTSLASPRVVPADRPEALDLVRGFLLHVVVPIWHPSIDGPGSVFVDGGWSLMALAAVPFALAAAYVVASVVRRRSADVGARRDDVALVVSLLAGATVPLVAGLVLNFQAEWAYGGLATSELGSARPLRYGVVPATFVLATVVVAIGRMPTRWARRGVPAAAAGLIALLAVSSFHVDATRRTPGPVWTVGLDRAVETCRDGGAGSVTVPIAPPGRGFAVTLECAELDVRER